MGEKMAKAKEAVGWATGDREEEAEGRAEAVAADPAEPVDDVTEEAVADEEDTIREERGELDPTHGPG